jgi:hypothetical protein
VGTPLEAVIEEFKAELERAGIHKLKPDFYLSNEWGVGFGTIGIAIPFYLARPDLQAIHAEAAGYLEGVGRLDLLRYLRHEMGHVVNYAYKLYEREDWIERFGAMTQPYEDDFRPEPFSPDYVQHLPGWYAQKHPDEDWAETFAVWMTPGVDWRRLYSDAAAALAKLEYCDRLMAEVCDQDPLVTDLERDEDVSQICVPVGNLYEGTEILDEPLPPGLDGALRTIFDDGAGKPAGDLIRRHESLLVANIYRWTGHMPERTRPLLRHLAQRAVDLNQVYAPDREPAVLLAFTTLVTSLAMNYVSRGCYSGSKQRPDPRSTLPRG